MPSDLQWLRARAIHAYFKDCMGVHSHIHQLAFAFCDFVCFHQNRHDYEWDRVHFRNTPLQCGKSPPFMRSKKLSVALVVFARACAAADRPSSLHPDPAQINDLKAVTREQSRVQSELDRVKTDNAR